MIDQGVWILAIMLYTGDHQIKLIPYEQFNSWQLCNMWKGRESLELKQPLVCIQEGGA